MKHIYLLFIAVFAIQTAQSQIIDFADANLKHLLVNTPCIDNDRDGLYNLNDPNADSNGDGEIDLNEAQSVTNLHLIGFSTYPVTSLEDLEHFVNLEYLYCDWLQLTEIDLSNLVNLKYLNCKHNQITNLNVSSNINLEYLYCEENDLTQLDLSGLSNLIEVNCSDNILSSIDLTGASSLKTLDCGDNQLTSLNTSNLINLETIKAWRNELTTLVLTNNDNLKYLNCQYSQLNSLDVSNLSNLESLYCNYNNISSLILSNNSSLVNLGCKNNQITTLNLSSLINLKQLDCSYNQFSTLNLDDLLDLRGLSCNNNQLSILNITSNSLLELLNCSNNSISSLDLSNNVLLSQLYVDYNQLNSLDISSSPNMQRLYSTNNQLTSINLPESNNLWYLYVDQNQLTSIDLSSKEILKEFSCNNNQINSLDLSINTNLKKIYCSDNLLTNIDISNNQNVQYFDCSNNELISLNVKNGRVNWNAETTPFDSEVFDFSGNPNLEYICSDDEDIPYNPYTEIHYVQSLINSYGYTNCVVNSYCSYTPGGEFFTIKGETKIDQNSDGCDINDATFPNLKFDITDGSTNGSVISNTSGIYTIPVQQGTHTLTPVLENTSYFTISPSNVSVTFPTEASPYTQDFCITPNGTHNDLEVTLIPIELARPGFHTNYKIFYKNKGTTTLSGTVDLTFDDDLMDLVSANPTADTQIVNNLSWNYSNLLPFESREILVTMNLNTPTDTPALNDGDSLNFVATVNPVAADETMSDNTFELSQLVVNSFDPNDKTCLEGNTITPDLIGEYVNYLIRFENTGTANAINIVVKDMIDTAKFDVSTLFLTDSSHDLVTRISGNKVEFIFENINLPFDDANNDGYIAFKIKTLATLVEGDTFENDAQIFFDYNFPIQTNVALTSIQSPLSIDNFELSGFEIYPNPSQNKLFINGLDAIKSVTIYDISGRLVNEVSLIGTRNNIEISTEKLGQGAYFVKIKTNVSEFVKKVVKD